MTKLAFAILIVLISGFFMCIAVCMGNTNLKHLYRFGFVDADGGIKSR